MKTTLRALGVFLTVVATTAGCGTMSVNPVVQYLDDTATTTAIKTRLATSAGMGSLTHVGVSTRDDVVRLSGTVADDATRRQVEAIARNIAGDNRVVSELQVASASASPTTEATVKPATVQPAVQKIQKK